MHTYKAKNGTIFHHSSDFSGTVVIVTPEPDRKVIIINGEDILELVANRGQKNNPQRIGERRESEQTIKTSAGGV